MEQAIIQFLLVEDDDDHATLIERCLVRSKTPCQVERVRDGVAALEFLRRPADDSEPPVPNVVILDVKLPRMSGLEVLEQIRADASLRHLPVVILTTSDADCDRNRAYELQVNSYLVKPMHYAQFRDLLASVSEYWGCWNRLPGESAK
ncbi:response regulator [bacterium]|nr:response regulator [bacterium]